MPDLLWPVPARAADVLLFIAGEALDGGGDGHEVEQSDGEQGGGNHSVAPHSPTSCISLKHRKQ